ncbi:MFS transporter [Methanophagales archaeon]|nr:MAG: MFS transporter [Methanophagales archaeon]
MKYMLVKESLDSGIRISIQRAPQLLGVSRCGFYKWLKQPSGFYFSRRNRLIPNPSGLKVAICSRFLQSCKAKKFFSKKRVMIFMSQSKLQPQIQAHRQLLLFSTILLLFCSFIGAIITVHPLYLKQFVKQPALVGLIATLSSLAGLAFSLPVGALSDRIGRKPMLIGVFSLISVVLLAFFINTRLYVLIGLQIAFGALMVPVWIVGEAFIKDISPTRRRGEFRSFFGTFANAGMLIGSLIGGSLAMGFGIRQPYIFAAILLLVPLILVFGLKEDEYSRSTNKNQAVKDFLPVLKEFLQQRELKILALCTLSLYFWYAAKWVFGPLFLLNLGYSLFIIGIWLAVSVLPFLLFQIPVGILSDKIGKSKIIYLGFFISTISLLPLGFESSISSLLATIFIVSIGTSFAEPLIEVRVTDIVQKERYGAYSGIFEFTKTLGLMLGPVGSSFFVHSFGISCSFMPAVVVFILTLALLVRLRYPETINA